MSGDFSIAAAAARGVPPPSSSSSSSASSLQQPPPHPQVRERSVAYQLMGMEHALEDILVCVDLDRQVDADMKVAGAKGQNLSRLDAIKQAIFLFVHSKVTMHPLHRFAFAALSHTATWLQQSFTSDMEVINNSVRALSSIGAFSQCDLTLLFRMAAFEAKNSTAQGRILRVILIYCRSDIVPTYPSEWPQSQYPFTFDALYLHDKPTQSNCPQRVYDALVEALERVSVAEGYIYESGTGLTRILFRQMCCLLAHPQQRCGQDDFEVPKDISRVTVLDGSASPAPTKREDDGGASHSFA